MLIVFTLPLAGFCGEERQLIDVLHKSKSPKEKDEACLQLKRIGTAACVPAVAELLTDPLLAVSARNVLEAVPVPQAEEALIQALSKTTGSNEIGIINSLGIRADAEAEPDLAKLLGGSDKEVAFAAATALGKIKVPAACQALQSAWSNSPAGPVHNAETDGMLACANRLLAEHEMRQALAVFQDLYDHEKISGIRMAAYRGVLLASEKRGLPLMISAIRGNDAAAQGAALGLASTLGGVSTTKALSGLLATASPAVQIALLQCLQQRGDRTAAHYMIDLLSSPNSDVRMAAIAALGDLGDGRDVLMLARQAANSTGAEKAAAREALVNLRHGEVTASMVRLLGTEALNVKVELISALGDRGDTAAAAQMLETARLDDDAVRSAAYQALALVAGPAQISGMIERVATATNEDVRSEAADALSSACQRLASHKRAMNLDDLAQAVRTAPLEARLALLNVCSGVSDAQICGLLRAEATNSDTRVREAAIRAMCNSQDEELLPDILKQAVSAPAANFRMLGIRGCVRLITDEQAAELPVAQKIKTLQAILRTEPNVEGKRLVLSGLASIADPRALAMAVVLLGSADVKTEAAEATVQIANTISAQHPKAAAAALKRVLAQKPEAGVRKTAQAALKKIKVKE